MTSQKPNEPEIEAPAPAARVSPPPQPMPIATTASAPTQNEPNRGHAATANPRGQNRYDKAA